jgi:hypothetical protein
MPLGSLAGGILGATVGVRAALLIGAIGGVLAPLAVYLSPLRTTRELPTVTADPEPGVPISETSSPLAESPG